MIQSMLVSYAWFFAGIYFLLTTGCGTMQVQVGDPLKIEALQSNLHIGESTKEEVLTILGVPDGRGRAMFPIDKESRTLWYYYYSEQKVTLGEEKGESALTMLWVYFKEENYDGFFWSSTFPRLVNKL